MEEVTSPKQNTEKLSLLSYVTVLDSHDRTKETDLKRIRCRVLSRFRHPLRYSILQFSILRGVDVFENAISRGIWPSFVAINELRPRDGNFPSGVITRNFNAVNHQQGNLAAIWTLLLTKGRPVIKEASRKCGEVVSSGRREREWIEF